MNTGGGTPAALVLEDGSVFRGLGYGATGRTFGEVVFCTGMTGYQETLTDPSYHKQIVVQTAPQIGNTGWNDEDDESSRIWVAGYAVRDPARVPSNWRSARSLETELERRGVVGIAQLDTRTLTRHIREHGAMRAGVFSGAEVGTTEQMLARVAESPAMTGADLAGEVTTAEPYVVRPDGPVRYRVAAVDMGIKSNTPRMMARRGIEVHVLPATATLDEVLAVEPHGVFLSNGPGDPATTTHVTELTRHVLQRQVPLFGICFGNQILGRALGLGTYKMRYGHRGMNIPVMDTATRRIAITAQNHGFALEGEPGARFDSPYGAATVSHYCPNDGTVEGVRCLDVPAFSVQYHPEAAAGPHDAAVLFDEFVSLMEGAS
ncbi:glutamine-hydrolyzing carbamoyl-phosphate synthase small subunit [Haloechinothrix sp. YIM 98757]|uniref:Carbamoyl phosphate synthase small chain n=1 Tax=Haloechinothrix aidingensis TaxID=2752311 RepID=A0A838A7J6_9PSEU|nr:glutamine-hydrolyzing carbamoyl-phosphate synthase small subunit [Haloechinothrix aidingensis]